MSKHTSVVGNDLNQLALDARALVEATAGVAGEQVKAARGRLVSALHRSKQIYREVREDAAGEASAADRAVREHLYYSLAIALTVGVLAGFTLARRYP